MIINKKQCWFTFRLNILGWFRSVWEYISQILGNRIMTYNHVRILEWIPLYSCLSVKEILDQNRQNILSLRVWVFIYKLGGCVFESHCWYLNFRYLVCFEQGVPWYLGNYKVWIHSKVATWQNKNIQSNAPYR